MRDVRLNEARMGRSGGVASSRRTSRRRIQSPRSQQTFQTAAPRESRYDARADSATPPAPIARREELFSRRERKDGASCARGALLRSGACHQVIVGLFGTCNKIAVRVPALGQSFVTTPEHRRTRSAGAPEPAYGEGPSHSLQALLM